MSCPFRISSEGTFKTSAVLRAVTCDGSGHVRPLCCSSDVLLALYELLDPSTFRCGAYCACLSVCLCLSICYDRGCDWVQQVWYPPLCIDDERSIFSPIARGASLKVGVIQLPNVLSDVFERHCGGFYRYIYELHRPAVFQYLK
jgi:hypothetical protein